MDNDPPGPMTERGGPFDHGCPCAGCPALTFGPCDCDLEEVDDEGLGGLPDLLCDLCGCCREHCRCYNNEDALEVEDEDILDAMDPIREPGLAWDAGADLAPIHQPPIHRAGQNHWVTRDLAHPWPGEEGQYFEEQRRADQTPPMTCPRGHIADFKSTVGTHVCQECGLIYVGATDHWISGRPAHHTNGEED
jgi:hypothetical protein